MRNKYPDLCFKCKKSVKAGDGHFQRVRKGDGELYAKYGDRWLVRCKDCVNTGNKLQALKEE